MIYLNDRFIGRANETKVLEDAYASRSLELVTVSGSSGCGKTALIREFSRNKRAVLFTATRTNGSLNLLAFSKAVSKALYKGLRSLVSFTSFTDAFVFLKRMSEKERLIIVIDSYDILVESDESIPGTINNLLYHELRNANMMIVLSGPEKFMERQKFSTKTQNIILGNLSFSDVKAVFSGYSDEDVLRVYAATGGYPEYVRYFNPEKPLRENIDEIYLHPESPLLNEPIRRFAAMVRNTGQYSCILSALSDGPKQMGEIVEISGVSPSSACSTYISSLIDLGIVEKKLPYGKQSQRKAHYCISDLALRFWFRFIQENRSVIEYRYEDNLYEPIMGKDGSYLARVFRDVCVQFITENGAYFDIHTNGCREWWDDTDRIDIVATDLLTTMFCDCFYRSSIIGMNELNSLMEKSERVKTIGARRYALFSKSGFTEELTAYSEKHQEITLVTLEEICRF